MNSTYVQVIDGLDELISENSKYVGDCEVYCLICLQVLKCLSGELDSRRLGNLQAAEGYWTSKDAASDEVRLRALREVVDRLNHDPPSRQNRVQIIDRLLVGALNPITELSSYTLEYVLEFSERLGIDADSVMSILLEHIPELEGPLP
jgi:hypothetical protein